MTDREKQILRTFAVIIPKLSESSKSYLLGLGERTEDGDFKELQYMDKVVHALYEEWFEPLYLEW